MKSVIEKKLQSPEVGENKERVYRVQAKQMSNKPNYELRVGLFTLLAVQLVFGGWSWLKGFSFFHPPQRFIVQFHDVAGLNNNAPVNINGVRVGVVEKIELSKTGQANITDPKTVKDTNPGLVYVHLKIATEETTIPVGSAITIQTQGMVGAKYIEITLPEMKPGQPQPADITPDAIIIGQDPVRIELVLNKVATKLNNVVNSISAEDVGPSLADALRHSGEAVGNINEAAKKLNHNMDRFEKASETFTTTAQKIGQVADSAKVATSGAASFFKKGDRAMDSFNTLAVDFQGTSKRMNKIFDNPALSGDLKETVKMARATAESISATVDKLNGTVKDPTVRGDILTMLTKIDNSLATANKSLSTVDKISDDREFRTLLAKFTSALSRFDEILGSADLQGDTKSTFAKLREASDNVNTAAEQIQNVLDKPTGMMRMFVGKNGELKNIKERQQKIEKDGKGRLVEKKPGAEQ